MAENITKAPPKGKVKFNITLSDEQKARFAERQKQVELAKDRGEGHIGHEAQAVLKQRKEAKQHKKELQRKKSA